MLTSIRLTLRKKSTLIVPLLLAVFCLSATDVLATHFRYGHLSWRVRRDLGSNVAEFTLFNAFRRDGYSGRGADGHPITGDIITDTIGETVLNFGDGTSLGTLDYIVIAYDPVANWVFCKALADRNNIGLPLVHTYSRPGPWVADIDTCCRITDSVNASELPYRVLTRVNTDADTFAPVSTLPPIVHCQAGGLCNFFVPAADTDGDTLRYRLPSLQEAGFVPEFAGFSVNPVNGQLSWNTAGRALGLYSVQVIIEAHHPTSDVLKSQIAVDFLINLTSVVPGTPPVFDQSTKFSCGDTFDYVAGKSLTLPVSAHDNDSGNIVSLNAIGLPAGASMTPGLPGSGNPIASTLNWTPSSTQGGPHVIVFTATDNLGLQSQCGAIVDVKVDKDGDGLPDDWEINGYRYKGTFVNLPALGANPNHKDIFVEIDYMTGHQPKPEAIDIVRNSFARVPNNLFAIPNPDGVDGITLHVDVDDEFPHKDQFGSSFGVSPNRTYIWVEFDTFKFTHFSEALSLSHHYGLFVHDGPEGAGGIARGSDFIVSLGNTPSTSGGGGEGGTITNQANTFMHELGHNLGLLHGGFEDTPNYKPNYLSVMNYAFGDTGLLVNGTTVIDYSRFELPPLNEIQLDETVGLNGGSAITNYGTAWFCGFLRSTLNANGPINWNCNTKSNEKSVIADINGDGVFSDGNLPLRSYNDWANLNFRGGLIGAGFPLPLPIETLIDEIELETLRTHKPWPPSGLSVQHSDCAVRLNWKPIGPLNDYSYRVYRSTGNSPFVAITTTDSTSVSDATIDVAQTYSYYVTTVKASGAESDPSEIATIKGGVDLLNDVKARVEGYDLDQNFGNSFLSKINAAQAALSRGSITAACSMLQSLVKQVDAQVGKKLTAVQANQLKTDIANVSSITCCQ